jgi:MSHA biogenesis protein MshQ
MSIFGFVLLLISGLLTSSAQAAITYIGATSGRNDALPTNGTDGALVIARPAGVSPGMALIASIAARPRAVPGVPQGVVWTPPAGWIQMTATNQANGGTATAPGGMTLLTYYKIVGTSEPTSYTWLFRNTYPGQSGSAVGGILAFSGIDTSASPIDQWAAAATPSATSHTTPSIVTTLNGEMIVSSISYLSAGAFSAPVGSVLTFTERIDRSAPATTNDVGTTLQMSTAPQTTAGATGTARATTSGGAADNGVANIMSLKPSQIDPSITMTRSGPLSPGGSASYAMTVTNVGVRSEPGPLTIVNTLPANVTFASATGSGWVCLNNSPAVGQVTCTRSGAVAAGASAPALTINVNVGAGASGVLTNSATVSGTGGDGNLSNNTAVDNFVILPTPYAYYAMDEGTWGSIADSSGNGRNATVLGSATATGVPPPTTPGAAIPGSPGTCGAGRIPAGTTAIGINTGIDVNSVGNAGTIAFWFSSNTAWNGGGDRILFDASRDGGSTEATDKSFFLAITDTGALQFSLEDSADAKATATSPSYSFAANTWHHVAVTWDMAADRFYIYLDGDSVPVATSTTNLAATLGDMAALYIAARQAGTITTSLANYTANSANGYVDEARIYTRALAPLEIEALADLTHACATTVDHYEMSLATASLACLPATVTVTACADATSPCTNRQTAVSGKTANLSTSAGTLSAATVTFDALGIANASLSYPAAANGANAVVTLSGETQAGANPRKCCPDGVSCAAGNTCTTVFSTAGFIFSGAVDAAEATFGNQVSGNSFGPYWLRAVKSSTTTKACEAAFTSPHAVTMSYQCIDPASCSAGNKLTVGASSIASAGTSVNLSFDANGNASLGSLSYLDVGRIRINASASVGGTTLSGASKGATGTNFIVKPYSLLLTDIKQTASPNLANPGAADATGSRFVRASENFSATVTSVNSTCAASLPAYSLLTAVPASCITPNYGNESTAEGATINSALVASLGMTANPALSNPAVFGAFNAGSATGTTFSWDEVGVITLTPAIRDGDYLGAGAASVQTTKTVGRFYPDHFDVTVTPQCGGFVYGGAAAAGQPFTVSAVAKNGKSPSAVTANYRYEGAALPAMNFSRALNLSLSSGGGVGSLYVGSTVGGSGAIPASSFAGGNGEVRFDAATGKISYGFTTFPTVATAIAVHAEDADTASGSALVAGSDGTVSLPGGARSGRLWLSNAYGSEYLPLNVPAKVQFYKTTGWETNALDTCTALTVPTNANTGLTNTLKANTTATLSSPLAAGDSRLRLSAPGAGHAGLVDISGAILRGANTWLTLPVPAARACFGACGPRSPVIYFRERY